MTSRWGVSSPGRTTTSCPSSSVVPSQVRTRPRVARTQMVAPGKGELSALLTTESFKVRPGCCCSAGCCWTAPAAGAGAGSSEWASCAARPRADHDRDGCEHQHDSRQHRHDHAPRHGTRQRGGRCRNRSSDGPFAHRQGDYGPHDRLGQCRRGPLGQDRPPGDRYQPAPDQAGSQPSVPFSTATSPPSPPLLS